MLTVTQVAKAMQTVLTKAANQAGRTTGFIKREVKLSGATFCQSLVFGWLANPEASLEELSQTAALVGVQITPQGLDQRRRRVRAEARRRGNPPSQTQLFLADWLVFVTNVPPEMLSFTEIFVVVRVRWQIELLFKLWKSHNLIDESRSQKPWRQLCEIYAKLIGVVIQHWMLLVGCWHFPNRSLFKAAQTIQKLAWYLASVFSCSISLTRALTSIQRCLAAGCRINKRKKIPVVHQYIVSRLIEQPSKDRFAP